MRFYVILLLLAMASGCQTTDSPLPDAVVAKGRLLKQGQPLVVQGREIGTGMVQLTFLPVEASPTAQPFAATADEQGNFEMPGGMSAGKYRLVIRQWEPYPTTDKLGGRYDEQNTTLVVEVDGKKPLEIDLP